MAKSLLLTGNAQLMKQINRATILSVIRSQGPISRAEIAKLTNLTPPTVTNIVGELIEEALVVEGERGSSSGGRKPILLTLNPKAGFILGVDIGSRRLHVLGVDLDANVQAHIKRRMLQQPTKEEFLTLLGDTIEETIRTIESQNLFPRGKLLGIGVGMHGIVDSSKGIARFAPNIQLHDVPIGESLAQRFQVPIQMENDVRAMAIGESWFGHALDTHDFICINVGYGIGAAIVLDKKLYHGISGSAGEIGHTTVDEDGARCSCGNYGCLQVMAAGPAIVSRAVKAIKMGAESIISQMVNDQLDEVTGATIHQAAMAGDAVAIKVLEDTGHYLGICIANLINIINPEKIIIGGGVAKAGDFLFASLRKTVEKRSLKVPFSDTQIIPTALGDHATAIGAASMILKMMFSSPHM